MAADVIEVDFRRSADPLDEVDEILDEIGGIASGIGDTGRRVASRTEWVENQWNLERRRVGSLKRELHRERSRNYPFTDDQVLAGLRLAHVAAPVRATVVAAQLYGREPTHSATVRVGLALSRLAASGCVRGARHRNDPSAARCWAPVEVDDAS